VVVDGTNADGAPKLKTFVVGFASVTVIVGTVAAAAAAASLCLLSCSSLSLLSLSSLSLLSLSSLSLLSLSSLSLFSLSSLSTLSRSICSCLSFSCLSLSSFSCCSFSALILASMTGCLEDLNCMIASASSSCLSHLLIALGLILRFVPSDIAAYCRLVAMSSLVSR